MQDYFNYRLDTSNPEDEEEKFENRMQKIITIWNKITAYFIAKGTKITIFYYDNDKINPNKGYPSTGYGVKNIILSDSQSKKEKNKNKILLN